VVIEATSVHNAVVVTLLTVAGSALTLVIAGALLVLTPERSPRADHQESDEIRAVRRNILENLPRYAPEGRHQRPASWRKQVLHRLEHRRVLVIGYLAIVAIVVIILIVWVLPSVLTQHPHIPRSADRHKAISDTRTGMVALLAAIGAAGGLAYTARTYRLTREGQRTDRYSKAVEQLGDEKIEIRLGGIYALERLMRDSPVDQPPIMETLVAFVRQRAPSRGVPPGVLDHPVEDVQAVLTVLGRRHPVNNEKVINLGDKHLAGANLIDADLAGARLVGADLTGANLCRANLSHADLLWTDLSGANFSMTNLSGALLSQTTLTFADLRLANLTNAQLFDVALDADLTGAILTGINLSRVDLTLANLTGATLTRGSLSETQLASARAADRIKWVEN